MDTIGLQQYPPQASPPASSNNGFPIMAIAILGIIAIFLVLVTYYSFVTSCRFRWQHLIDSSLGRFSFRRTQHHQDLFMAFSPSLEGHGLDEMMIREIPSFLYSRTEGEAEESSLFKCVVCLNEFQDQDMLRLLPRCNHAFHLDCIDIWLQTNANCPLCRAIIISGDQIGLNMIVAPSSSPQDHQPFTISRLGSDEHLVMILLTEEEGSGQLDGSDSTRHLGHSRGHSSRKSERKLIGKLTSKKLRRVSIMGDECINVRGKDDQFSVQPIRRSFSMDSAADRHVYLSVQGILRHNRQLSEVRSIGESSSRSHRSIFSFGQGRGSKNAVIPIDQS